MTNRLLAALSALLLATAPSLAATGALDPDFGSGGTVVTDGSGQSGATAVAIQADGRIVVAGNSGGEFALARYSANGTLETAFGEADNGIGVANLGAAGRAQALSILPGGAFLTIGGASKFGVAVFFEDGDLDKQFTIPLNTWWGYGLAMKPDNGFVISGEAGNGRATCALASATSAGQPDAGFGTNGVKITDIGRCKGVVRLADGRLVTTTDEDAAGNGIFGIARFAANGELDATFGTAGVSQAFADSFAFVSNIVRQPDGKYLAVGQAGGLGSPKSLVVARFNEDGTPDSAGFGVGGGAAVIGLPISDLALVGAAVVLDAAGNVIVGGTLSGPSNVKDGAGPSAFVLIRLLPNGLPDDSFGDDGAAILVTGFGTGSIAELEALAMQPDGKVVAVGKACSTGLCRFALARYVLSPPVPVTTTTTTTLPGGGGGTRCETRVGFDGLACLCATPIPTAACAGQTLSKAIGNTFRKACAAKDKASAATKEKIARKLLKRTGTFFKQADTHTRRQARKKKRGITADCAASLQTIFTNGRALAGATVP